MTIQELYALRYVHEDGSMQVRRSNLIAVAITRLGSTANKHQQARARVAAATPLVSDVQSPLAPKGTIFVSTGKMEVRYTVSGLTFQAARDLKVLFYVSCIRV